MIKLSDYLNYLNQEVVQARKKADEYAIEMAKEYAKHEYLQYFRAPRFIMPSVKMEIPIKIAELDADVKYDFKMDNDSFVQEVNTKIRDLNVKENMKLNPITKDHILNKDFQTIVKQLEKKDQKFIRNLDMTVNKVHLSLPVKDFIIKSGFSASRDTDEENMMADILRESLLARYKPVSARLNSVYIDPNTMGETDKGKLLLNLNVEMVEEGLKITHIIDADGNEIEEVIVD